MLGRALSIATVLLVAGCSSLPSLNPFDWWGNEPVKLPELPSISNAVPVRTLWQSNVGGAGPSVFFPSVVAGQVYAASQEGGIAQFDGKTGRQNWRIAAGSNLSGGVGADADLVVAGTVDGEVMAFSSKDGALRWRTRVSSEMLAAPVVAGELVVVRSSDSRVFALDAKDGRRRWVYQRSAGSLSIRSPAGLVVHRGYAYAGFSGGKLVAIALSNGGVRWESTVALPKGSTELERVTDVVGLPWLSEREVCAVAFQGRVACFDINTGAALWAREMSSFSGLQADARYLFVTDDRGAVHALDRSTGTSVWKQEVLARRNLTAPLALGNDVVVSDIQGNVHLLSRDTGALTGRFATDGSGIAAAPIPLDSGFLVQTRNGSLYALAVR
jgi:outer membrane protein assembly factor BamB